MDNGETRATLDTGHRTKINKAKITIQDTITFAYHFHDCSSVIFFLNFIVVIAKYCEIEGNTKCSFNFIVSNLK